MADYGWLKGAGGANAAVLMGSLPKILRTSLDAFPHPHRFLVPDAAEKARWRKVFESEGGRKIIGLSWRSGKVVGAGWLQYAPLQDWAQFLRGTEATFVCAQYGATDQEIADLQAMSGRKIIVPEGLDQKNELDRTCAMLAALEDRKSVV